MFGIGYTPHWTPIAFMAVNGSAEGMAVVVAVADSIIQQLGEKCVAGVFESVVLRCACVGWFRTGRRVW